MIFLPYALSNADPNITFLLSLSVIAGISIPVREIKSWISVRLALGRAGKNVSLNILTFSFGLLVIVLSFCWIEGKKKYTWPSLQTISQACYIAFGESQAF